jgi:hypothetical protein
MTEELVVRSTSQVTRRTVDTLREQLAPRASDEELHWLAAVGARLGLDPIAGHVVLIPRWDGRLRREVHRPQITADGRLVLAERTGELDGFTGPEWTGPRDVTGQHRWVDLWDEDEPPHAARVFVYRRGRTHPANGTVRWAEFAQFNSKNELLPTWKKMPSHMLGKVALSLGLRRAFGDVIPQDAEVEDDFAPYERDSVVLSADPRTGEIAPEPENATPLRPEPPPPAPEPPRDDPPGTAALAEKLGRLSFAGRDGFKAWRRSKGFDWPPASAEVLRQMQSEYEAIAQREAEHHDTYEPEVGSRLD